MTEVVGPDQLIGNANGNKERNARKKSKKIQSGNKAAYKDVEAGGWRRHNGRD